MIALDTNVLVRFLIEDDPAQSARARRLIEKAVENDDAFFVSDIAVCETVWVMQSCYRVARKEIARPLRTLLTARNVAFASADQLARALDAFASGRGDFADYLIREHARAAGCTAVVTFDRTLLKEPGFVAP